MLTKNDIKHIRSLSTGKFRRTHQCFIAEGKKVIGDMINSGMNLINIYCVDEDEAFKDWNPMVISPKDMDRISTMKTPPGVLAVFEIPKDEDLDWNSRANNIVLACEDLQDPGNAGTIIRTADWFGLHHLFLTKGSVDVYSPKVVQASMGSLSRIKVHYVEMKEVIAKAKEENYTVFAAAMDGKSIFDQSLKTPSLVILGNESNGISQDLMNQCDERISIPSFGGAESLNVAMAGGIILAEARRASTFEGKGQ